ncbi:MAG: pseudouridine synthase [Crocinitomicaceae bacterium]|nr:pseudouridine synthase [Crocinitomicaceae bacterium]|tara:strand:- start:24866 stop:25789 length:924 start_codon:yes stop_codon:yes gene_type:complete
MKDQKGSGRRGGARRTKPESKSFVPKKKISRRTLSQKSSEYPENPKKTKRHKPSYSLKRKLSPKLKPLADSNAPMRLNRFVAQAGICSRREADVLIAAGVVSVNGEVITEMGYRVSLTDKVQVEGDTIKAETKRYILLNKPKNFLATAEDHRGRRTVMQLIKGACQERVYPVGRLDKETTGLLLLTNDGEMAKRLSNPKTGVRNLYQASIYEKVKNEHLLAMLEGFVLDEKFVRVDKASYVNEDPRQIGIEIHSSRNRIVRRIFEHFGYRVTKLDRVVFCCLTKKNVPRGDWRHVTEQELNILRMTT